MRLNSLKAIVKTALRGAAVLLLGAGVASAQQTINLSAGATTATLPDGNAVPMWGYTCGALVTGTTATCARLNPAAAGWTPVLITVPVATTGSTSLTINLTNNLIFGANLIPTSLTIVGQLGGGLGTVGSGCTGGATCTPSPDHSSAQSVTWPIVDPTTTGTPPDQGNRVQSFSTEVAAGATTALTWASLQPGTYLIESGTHPSIQGPMGLYGVLVVTTAPVGTTAGTAYPAAGTAPAVTYNADIPMLLGEIDPVQNNSVSAAVNTVGFSETMVWSGLPGGCGNSTSATYHQCYPPTVNYTPLYFTINGAAFTKSNPTGSFFPPAPGVTVTPGTGKVLLRLVNAGLHMHIPSILQSRTQQLTATNPTGTAVPGFSLIAEDGNPLPGLPRVQSEIFMAAGKTYDVMINGPLAGTRALSIYDRELSLSANATAHDAGMLAYLNINGALLTGLPSGAAVARADTYNSVVTGHTLTVSDPSKGVIANDTNVYGVQLVGTVAGLTLNSDGTFTYTGAPRTFTYCANGTVTGTTCSSGITAVVTLGAAPIEAGSGILMNPMTFTSNISTSLKIASPGVLSVDKDTAGYPLVVNAASVTAGSGLTLSVDASGGFNASVAAPGTYTFTYRAQNSQGTLSATAATVTVIFPQPSNLAVTVVDGKTLAPLSGQDYRWIIEEDRTFYIDPTKTTNTGTTVVPTFGTNFHTSYMPIVATGCTGPLSCESGQSLLGVPAVCDGGNGVCRTSATQQQVVLPSQVHLDPTKRYYLSVIPGDAANSFENTGGCLDAGTPCGHGMGGAPITIDPVTHLQATAVTVLVQSNPFPPSKLSVFVFEDDFPLNGENDAGGQIVDNQLGSQEPGLGSFNITLFDDAGGPGDATGQMTYDMFNMPLSNSLDGTIDPASGHNACPISRAAPSPSSGLTTSGITGTIVTCPTYEDDGVTQSPLAGQAVVANLMPGRYGVVATPAADRIGRGEEWLQTNTLDGQKAHDSFLRVGEPSFFQEYGPASYHVVIGFANPKIINSRKDPICNGGDPNSGLSGTNCTNSIVGTVTTERMSRTPDERLYSSGDNTSFSFTQCYVSFGDPDGEDFAFTKCNADGSFSLSGLPDGDWRITVFDQWNDMLVDGLSTPVRLAGGTVTNMGDMATNQWQSNIYTTTFFDLNGNGVRDPGEEGLALSPVNNRFRDGSYSNFNNTDLEGYAGFNEIFPLFSWYVIESEDPRYKNTGTHVVYDAGGPADGTTGGGTSAIAANLANTLEAIPVPTALRVPGAFYCATADCTDAPVPLAQGGSGGSTGRVDPPWVWTEGWQGFSGQNNIIEFGKKPYAVGETGGIHGEVIYASTRPFDDPGLLIHTSWTPDVPNVTINLYQEGTAPDGSTSLKLVDTTKTSSFDDWAQGFRTDGVPNMNCPGQGAATGTNADLFFFSLFNQPEYLDVYNNGGTPAHTLPNNSQFKCYDGMHNWNQVQPAPYDGMYIFPSVTGRNPITGNTTGTNCTICVKNNDATDPFRFGKEDMLPAGKYVVEMVMPPGYELVKEEDKNILIGDNYIAPVSQEFAGLGNIFILPDQASVAASYNANNPQMPTTNQGRTTLPSTEADTGSVEQLWPCVGQMRVVPDFISLFPGSGEVAPFAGATRPLCDRKEVNLVQQAAVLAKFWIFTSTHAAAHFTGVITDDFTSEFDPFSPQFGEKFSPPDMPISIKDWTGAEIARTYADHWGAYNGLTYSTWEVNPPNPTGYAPTMMITCMNDPGTGATPDALYNPQYSNFCYEIPFMPGQTQYMDTPVTPTSAFAGAGYNNPDCAYPDATPAISEVDGDQVGPWVSAGGTGHTLTITALGDQTVPNNAYSGPSATAAPFNAKTVTRHYGFGATAGTVALVGTDGVSHPLTGVSWSDGVITGVVPVLSSVGSTCPIQQQFQYKSAGATTAVCFELVITAANGKSSIDSITVTIGGKPPTHVAASGSIQDAIDKANPGDLIMIDPTCTAAGAAVACSTATGTRTAGAVRSGASAHSELLLMWKPVRLQGVGAASSIIDGNTHPAGKLDTWRARVNCLFGLGLTGTHNLWNASCGAGLTGFKATANNPQVDRLPLEAIVGWDASLNGNLAQLLQEPTLMGALEGAAITVLSKGVNFPTNPFLADTFPVGSRLLTNSTSTSTGCGANLSTSVNPFPSNFWCNPSSIDGLNIRNSSQGGGGIFVHAWGHNLQISNNRVANNSGTLSGGINIGQGEFPSAYLGGAGAVNADPGSCQTSTVANLQLPYCHNMNVNVNHNYIAQNSSTGDELFSATPAGAGGITFCTGADFYKFQYNWVCGNLSTGDGGGFGHVGMSYNGDIEHNSFLFNQSTNPTIPTNGGGLIVMGAPDADPVCGTALADTDCVVAPGVVSPSDGVGPNLVINANLIMGNSADSGSGGGIAFQNVNGSDVVAFPGTPTRWFHILVTNNIITNNVAGWDGAGISLLDALNTDIVNNTIASNDTTASSGVLFNTLGAPLASNQGPCGTDPVTGNPASTPCVTTSTPQPAGVVSIQNSAVLAANIAPLTLVCPAGHYAGTLQTNGICRSFSYPLLDNDVLYQNRVFYIGVGSLGAGTLNQQNIVTLYTGFTTTAAGSQTATGSCPTASYWDIGVRGDTGPTNHASTVTLNPTYSFLTTIAGTGYDGAALHNNAANPALVSKYCNGSRIPPEFGGTGFQVPPGISDATVPNPVFNLTPAATVDEGNNWINLSWGPLALINPVTNAILGNYAQSAGSPVINYVPSTATANFAAAPATDFFGNARKANNAVDAGAVEFQPPPTALLTVSPSPLAFGSVPTGTTSALNLTLTNSGAATATGITIGTGAAPFTRTATTCGTTLAAATSCTITITFAPTAIGAVTGTETITASVSVGGAPVTLTGTGVARVATASLTPTSHDFGTVARGTTTAGPIQVFTLTNTGNVPLTGIGQGALGGTNTADYFVIRGGALGVSSCGPAGGGQVQGLTTLAPGAACVVTVQFRPLTTEATGAKSATISVTDSVGTQTSTLTGTANP